MPSLSVPSGSAVTRITRSWFLRCDLRRASLVPHRHQVLRLQDLTAGRADQHVVQVFDALAIRLTQPHDDRILVAAFAELRGLRAADAGADRVRDTGHRQAEERRLRAVHLHGELRAAFVAADAGVADLGTVHHVLHVERGALRCLQIVAEDLGAMRESPLPSRRLACWLPPDARVWMITPEWRFRQLTVQVAGDLLARALALVLGHQADRHLGAAAATAATTTAAAKSAAAAR